jgi:hypothetical protein
MSRALNPWPPSLNHDPQDMHVPDDVTCGHVDSPHMTWFTHGAPSSMSWQLHRTARVDEWYLSPWCRVTLSVGLSVGSVRCHSGGTWREGVCRAWGGEGGEENELMMTKFGTSAHREPILARV